ncbi:origin recognition complex subunit 4 [Kalmusia sp. IMI 367209]|nr:origin recognition complex subunit 4 [Kalmusia sp. IMI 367209]
MGDSPRASKRRKLDTPTRNAPSPLAKPSTSRKSGRLSTRSVSYTNGTHGEQADDSTSPKSAPRSSLRKVNGVGHRQTVAKSADVWDDIEGALGEIPSKRSTPIPSASVRKRPSRKKLLEDAANTSTSTDELQRPSGTPRQKQGKHAPNGESASRSSFRSLVNGFRHSDEIDTEEQDELEEPATPSRRASKRAAPSSLGRGQTSAQVLKGNDSPSKPGSLRKPRASVRPRTSQVQDDIVVTTPSARCKQERSLRFRDDDTIPETEDELRNNNASASRAASARRRAHRADHANNRSEEISYLDEEQAEAGAEEADDDAMSIDGNSILGSVLDPTEPSPFNKPASAQKVKADIPIFSGFAEPGRELDLLKTIVLERISGKRPVPLAGLDEEYRSVHQIVEHTVTAGEGNSMLVIGARGSGKTALVNRVLSEVSKDNAHDFHIVRLNGFIHTDDKIALREIWRQLGKEMDLDEEGGGVGKNYADTLTTLLALLSHPSEHTGELTDQVAKAVIFIIDEFDLFAHHPRQTLLYNLFDIAQSRKAPIAVLGLTARIDVANSLEKRVKSRFSHRYVHLSLAKTFTAFQEICKANLLIQPDFLTVEERGVLESVKKTPNKKAKANKSSDVLSQWNSNITNLFISKTFLTTHLAPLFYRSKSIPTTLTTFLLSTASLSSSLSLAYPTTLPPDSKLSLILGISTLALSLLIAAARLDIIHDSDTCNFNMAYDEYVTLASKARIQSAAGGASASGSMSKVWGRRL